MLKIITSMAVVVCSVPLLFAQDTDGRVKELFRQLDKDGDGLVTRGELDGNEAQLKLFEHYLAAQDNDRDGKLSQAEFLKVFEPPKKEVNEAERPDATQPASQQGMDAASVFSRLDDNQDGQLEPEELPGPLRQTLGPTYKSLGKDSLTLEEFAPPYQLLMAKRPQQPGLPAPDTFFEFFDTNKDGKVTLDEVPEEAKSSFKQMFEQLETEFITKDGYTQIYELLVERAQRDDAPERPEGRRDDRGRANFMGRPPGGEPGLLFGMLDNNRDGKLSGSELSQAPQLVASLDRNEDGLLDPSEILAYGRGRRDREGRFGPPGRGRARVERTDDRPDRPQRPALANERDEPQEPKATAETSRPETAPPRTTRTNLRNASNAEFVDELFLQFDGNQDGKLSREEAPARLQRSFGRLDLDADDSVSKEELTKGLGG